MSVNLSPYESLDTLNQQRIDVFLSSQFPYSRNFFHHIIKRGGVLVNNKTIKKSYKLQNGDVVTIDDLQRYLEPALLDEAPEVNIPVVYEGEHMLVINKPKWVLSHPNSIRDVQTPSVVGFLYHNYKELPSIGSFIRAWLVHRLDKETNGLMVVAKTEEWLTHLKSLFQKKSEAESISSKEAIPLHKYYSATCHITSQWLAFIQQMEEAGFPYIIDEDVIPKVPRSVTKRGITKVLAIEKHDNKTTTCKLEILTWRTHQIRYHLSNHGLPIIGDYLYGTDEWVPMALTAYRLELESMSWELLSFEI